MSDSDRRQRLINAFKTFDVSGDGTVDTKCIVMILTTLGMRLSPSEASELVSDADQNGKIYYREYIDKVLLATT